MFVSLMALSLAATSAPDWQIGAVGGQPGAEAPYVVIVDFGSIIKTGTSVRFMTRLILQKPIGEVDNIVASTTANCNTYTYRVLTSDLMAGETRISTEKVSGRTEVATRPSSAHAYLERVCGDAPLDGRTLTDPYNEAKRFLNSKNR